MRWLSKALSRDGRVTQFFDRHRFLRVLIGALLLATPSILSGHPTIYSDTRAYYALGQQIAEVVHLAPKGSAAETLNGASTGPSSARSRDPRLPFTVAGSRSPTYSTAFYLIDRFAGGWMVVAGQALLAAWAIEILANALGLACVYFIGVVVVTFASSLPIVVGFLMPDVFMGIAAVIALYFIHGQSKIAPERVLAFFALVFCLSTHQSNIVILAGLLVVELAGAALLRARLTQDLRPKTAWVAAAIVLGLGIGMAYSASVKVTQHQALKSPPFMAARALADGPGRRYLDDACAKDPSVYALCAFRDRPLTLSDDILWSMNPKVGVFEFADYDTRLRIIAEQNRFLLGTIRFDPAGMLIAASSNFLRQLTLYQIDESYADPDSMFQSSQYAIFREILPDAETCTARPHACAPRLNYKIIDAVVGLGLLAALALMAASARSVARRAPRLAGAALSVVIILVINAAVCGVLSEPEYRYQDRVAWIVVLTAAWMAVVWLRPARAISASEGQ
jgi:hypothetical protein